MKLAPIVLFVFNRHWHTRKTIDSLKKNNLAKDSDLFIYSDGAKEEKDIANVEEVRDYVNSVEGFKKVKVTERKENLGLANSIISGTTEVINRYGRVIVIEDDLIFTPNFLRFINEALEFYKNNKKVFSITGYNFPSTLMKIPEGYPYNVYFSPRCSSWGWATWKDRWEKVDWGVKDFDDLVKDKRRQRKYALSGDDKMEMLTAQKMGKIDSWAIRWDYAHFKNDAFCLYPAKSFIDNIGFDGSGVHCDSFEGYRLKEELKDRSYDIEFLKDVRLNRNIMREFRKVFRRGLLFNLKKIIKKIIFYEKWRNH